MAAHDSTTPRRRWGTTVRHLTDDPDAAVELAARLDVDTIAHLAAALRDEMRRRAISSGDHDAMIDEAFEQAFGRDGLGGPPWIEGQLIICPGSIVAKNRSSHRCRFVSVDDVWIWDSIDLVREEKRSHPGREDGFKAVALLPVVEPVLADLPHLERVLVVGGEAAGHGDFAAPVRSNRGRSTRIRRPAARTRPR